MKQTDNYGLTLYDKEDKFNITAEENSLNANMKIIDSKLKEIEDNSGAGGGGIPSIEHDDTITGAGTQDNPLGVNKDKFATINGQNLFEKENISITADGSSISIGDEVPTGNETLWIDTSRAKGNNTSYLKTLKVGCLGDSITYGVGGNGTTYPKLLAEDFGEVINYGVSGTLVGTGWGSNAMCERYVKMRDDLDIVIVMGGTNDFAKRAEQGTAEETFGDSSSTNTDTFYGALNVLMKGLINKYPYGRIFFCSPIHISLGYNSDTIKTNGKTLYDYRNAIKEMCTKYSITFIDTMTNTGMDIAHSETLKNLYAPDGCHPSRLGYIRIHDCILQAIKSKLGELENPAPVVLKYKNANNEWEILSDRGVSTASSVSLTSITAVYTQGSQKVYPNTDLNSLKTNLVVTGVYSDGSTTTIPASGYTLSGTLKEGETTVTVTASGKTTTFTVNVIPAPTLQSITAVYSQGTKKIYPDDSLDILKEDLVVTGHYSDESTTTITDYTLSGTLQEGSSNITVTASGKTTTFTVNVSAPVVLSSIEAVYTQGETIIYANDNLDNLKDNLVVTAVYSDGERRTITDYELSGTLTTGTSTITVSYQDKTTMFTVSVTAPREIENITAVYTQGTQKVYTTDSLDKLKSNLVVTAFYNDDTEEVVADYVLSGELTEGTSTITVTYQSKTATFDVTVGVKTYEFYDALITDGNSYINTEVIANQDTTFEVKEADDTVTIGHDSPTILQAWNGVTQLFGINGHYWTYNNMYPKFTMPSGVTRPYTYSNNIDTPNLLYVNGQKVTVTGGDIPYAEFSLPDTVPLYAFARGTANGVDKGKTVNGYGLSYVKIWEKGVLTRSFIPAKRLSDNKIGMYDEVNDKFYENAGTGTFTTGAVI